MITIERRLPVTDAGDPACPDGRLLALKCLGIPQVATRAALSRRRTLVRSLAAFCARIQPRNTAELASLVLHMGEEIDRRERMLDAALRAMVSVPGERTPASPAASRPPARAGQPEQECEPATV
jgi:ribonuclease D